MRNSLMGGLDMADARNQKKRQVGKPRVARGRTARSARKKFKPKGRHVRGKTITMPICTAPVRGGGSGKDSEATPKRREKGRTDAAPRAFSEEGGLQRRLWTTDAKSLRVSDTSTRGSAAAPMQPKEMGPAGTSSARVAANNTLTRNGGQGRSKKNDRQSRSKRISSILLPLSAPRHFHVLSICSLCIIHIRQPLHVARIEGGMGWLLGLSDSRVDGACGTTVIFLGSGSGWGACSASRNSSKTGSPMKKGGGAQID